MIAGLGVHNPGRSAVDCWKLDGQNGTAGDETGGSQKALRRGRRSGRAGNWIDGSALQRTSRNQWMPQVPPAEGRLDALVAQTFDIYDGEDAYREFVSGSPRGRILPTF